MAEPRTTQSEFFEEIEATPKSDDASSRLRDDAFATMSRAGSDRVVEQGGEKGAKKFDNPYDHIGLAGVANNELETLKGKKPDEKVTIMEDGGRLREVTVGERRAELQKIVETELDKGIGAADRIDQDKVTSSLWEIRTRQSNATDISEFDKLSRQEAVFESMRHAPSVARFAAATWHADQGDQTRAKTYLDQIAEKDREAALDPIYQELKRSVEATLTGGGGDAAAAAGDPFATLGSAAEKWQKGDARGAEEDFKKAIQQAKGLDPALVSEQLKAIEEAKKDPQYANNPEAQQQLKDLETAWKHPASIIQVNYAEFLLTQNRQDEAKALLAQVAKDAPDLVRDNEDFKKLERTANEQEKEFDNPFIHHQKFQEAYEKGDLKTARAELEAAVKASESIDRELMKENKKVVEEQLKEAKDPKEREQLESMRAMYDAFEHASAASKLALGRFELAEKNYNSARDLFEQVQKDDPEFAKRDEVKMDELMEASEEPSTWGKVWGFTKSLFKELVCDAAAILAGVGAAVLTGWSGPAAVGVGAVAGAATYTAMKALMGEEIHWYTPLWGALDGASGGTAAIARTALTRVGGKIVSKEVAEAALLKTGQNVAAVEGLQGMKMGSEALTLARQGVKQMGKELPLWARFKSHLPLVSAGNAEYRAAMGATNALRNRMLAANFVRDAGTAGTMSLVYRGGHEGYKYATGEHKDFGSFAKSYAFGVGGDAVTGGFLGPMGRWLGDGMSSGFVGRATGLGALRNTFPTLGPTMDAAWTAASPRAYEAYGTYDYLNNTVEPVRQYYQEPLDPERNKREIIQRHDRITNYYAQKEQGPYRLRDWLQPQVDGRGNIVRPDEEFSVESVLGTSDTDEDEKQ